MPGLGAFMAGLSQDLGAGSSMLEGADDSQGLPEGADDVHEEVRSPPAEAFAARALQLGIEVCTRRGTFLRGGATAWDAIGRALLGAAGADARVGAREAISGLATGVATAVRAGAVGDRLSPLESLPLPGGSRRAQRRYHAGKAALLGAAVVQTIVS